jgi:flagella basal body P-ring formation protein FlgA
MAGRHASRAAAGGLAAAAGLVAAMAGAPSAPAQEALAERTLRPGEVIRPGDLAPGPDGNRASVEALSGLEVRRAIYRGRPVDRGDLGPPTLVRRNALVRLIFRRGGLGIRAEGRALDSGGAGERVRVMNLGSRRIVSGVVTPAGRVEIR